MTDLLRNRAEGCPCPDRLQLLMVSNQHDLRATLFRLAHKRCELPASHHARLVDHEHIATPKMLAVVLPTAWP
ncbi:hypothetical protein F4695_004486 [Rhizobium soli]|uniref:Uncharacterized protein n=1 Tax=Rhizobium soli TaxID=424798 RepID=A0A7X0JP01_9HYPH|nr:hypothetical protein [Rhizobium soli]